MSKSPRSPRPRSTASLSIAVVCAALVLVPPASATPADPLFEQHEIVASSTRPSTVLTGFLLGGAMADLALVTTDEEGGHTLEIYAHDGESWRSGLRAPLPTDVLLVDVANIGGGDRLVLLAADRFSWFDPSSGSLHPLVEVPLRFRSVDQDTLPHVDLTRDLNRDGRDDLLAPDVDGFWVAVQREDGTFTEAVQLGPPEPFASTPIGNLDVDEPASDEDRTYGDVGITALTAPVYSRRVHQADFDLDGRTDLVFWNRDRFDVHLQSEDGGFATEPTPFTSDVAIDSDGAYSRAFDYVDQGVWSMLFGFGEHSERTVLHSLSDLNGDGAADLVRLTLSGRTITKQRSLYEIHFGEATGEGLGFRPDADASIRPTGRAGAMQPWGYASQSIRDFDGDGTLDILFQDVKVGLGGMARTMIGKSVPIDLEYYCMTDNAYPDRPTSRHKIRRFAPFSGMENVIFPVVLTGDVNGDGRPDLLVGENRQELQVFLGVPGRELLAKQPLEVAVELPRDERNARLIDLDADGKQDLLVIHPPTPDQPADPLRITALIVR